MLSISSNQPITSNIWFGSYINKIHSFPPFFIPLAVLIIWIILGQMTILKNHKRAAPLIQEMWDQEKAHLKKFEELLITYNVTPTIFQPLWKVAGFTLGKLKD